MWLLLVVLPLLQCGSNTDSMGGNKDINVVDLSKRSLKEWPVEALRKVGRLRCRSTHRTALFSFFFSHAHKTGHATARHSSGNSAQVSCNESHLDA
jgi:hypothetical protein